MITNAPVEEKGCSPASATATTHFQVFHCYLSAPGMRTFLMKAGGKLFCCILELLPCTRSLSEVLLTGLFACVAPFISEQPVDCLR